MIRGNARIGINNEIDENIVIEFTIDNFTFCSQNSKTPEINFNFEVEPTKQLDLKIKIIKDYKLYYSVLYKIKLVYNIKQLKGLNLFKLKNFKNVFIQLDFENFIYSEKKVENIFRQKESEKTNKFNFDKEKLNEKLNELDRKYSNIEDKKKYTAYKILSSFLKYKLKKKKKKKPELSLHQTNKK